MNQEEPEPKVTQETECEGTEQLKPRRGGELHR